MSDQDMTLLREQERMFRREDEECHRCGHVGPDVVMRLCDECVEDENWRQP